MCLYDLLKYRNIAQSLLHHGRLEQFQRGKNNNTYTAVDDGIQWSCKVYFFIISPPHRMTTLSPLEAD